MHLTRAERAFAAVNYFALTLLTIIFLIPLISVLSTSFAGQSEYAQGSAFVLIPHRLDLGAYQFLLAGGSIVFNAYKVTLFRVVVGTLLDLAFTATLAFVLARRDLPGRTAMTVFVFFTMLFSGGLIPTFKLVQVLHLLDNDWVLILPGLINPFYLLIMRNFFAALPAELEEAAIVDGASPPVLLWRIVLPLSMPSLATIGLFYAVGHWNAWFDAAIYLQSVDKLPVQNILQQILSQGLVQDSSMLATETAPPPTIALQAAMVVISTLPILCIYPFVQRYFVKGTLIGAVKG
jgi:putative aldouronate transport system permease protein